MTPRICSYLMALVAVCACSKVPTECLTRPATWEVTPNPIRVVVGGVVDVQVEEVGCGRVRVYPPMTVLDSTVAFADPLYQTVRGRHAGTTTLLVERRPAPGIVDTLRVDVVVTQ